MLTISGTTGVPPTALPFMIGQVCFFALPQAPSGFLVCNGGVVSRQIYAELFAAMGTLYGAGDGSTTFNLPDLRGEFIRGWDAGRGIDAGRALGSWQNSSTPGGGLAQFESGRNPVGENNTPGVENVPADGSWSGWRVTGRSMDGDDHHIRMRNVPSVEGGVVHPRNMALLPCVYVGTPVVASFTAATLGWYPSGSSLQSVFEVLMGQQSAYTELAFMSNGAIAGTTNSGAPLSYLSALGNGFGANFEISAQISTLNNGDTLTVFGSKVEAAGYQSGWMSLSNDRVISAFSRASGSGSLTTSATGSISIRAVGQPGTTVTIPFTITAISNAD